MSSFKHRIKRLEGLHSRKRGYIHRDFTDTELAVRFASIMAMPGMTETKERIGSLLKAARQRMR